jgi:hypothetical protein
MQFKTVSKRIGDHKYTVTQLNAVTGRKALLRLTKIMGPVITEGFKGGQMAGYAAVAQSLTETELDYFCDLFAGQTTVLGGDYVDDGAQLDAIFGEHFADRYFEMFEWLTFALEVNFGSFFLGLAKKFAEALKKAKDVQKDVSAIASDSPSTSTSGSGD